MRFRTLYTLLDPEIAANPIAIIGLRTLAKTTEGGGVLRNFHLAIRDSLLATNLFRMRIYAKGQRKSFRIRFYAKHRGWVCLVSARLARTARKLYAGRDQGTTSEVLDLKQSAGAVTFSVRVQPRASKDEIAGVMDGALKVRLQAPALEDRANEALREYLAQLLKTPKSAVRILSGQRSRIKRIEVRGVAEQQVLALLMHDA